METLEQGGHLFPGIWRHLLPEEFTWQTPPREHRATCDDCYLVTLGDFAADCQCCTYSPQIPNFLVGLALKDPRSRDAMMRQIEAGGALPRELVNAPGRFRRALALHEYGRFGRDTEATCRFYDRRTTQCRIYPYRNSVCSTFICAHDHGEDGEYYWERLQQLVAERLQRGVIHDEKHRQRVDCVVAGDGREGARRLGPHARVGRAGEEHLDRRDVARVLATCQRA